MSDDDEIYREQQSLFDNFREILSESDEMSDDDFGELSDSSASLEHYKRESEIGRGGVKVITQMIDYRTGRSIAMATLRSEYHKPSYVERFLREARTLAGLEHPNIVPLYEISHYKDRLPFFTMKLLSGDTLANVLKKKGGDDSEYSRRFDLKELLGVFYKVCDAIAYAHSKSILHLDLKPENIQISEFGEVLVLDWGFAKNIKDEGESEGIIGETEALHIPLMDNMTRVGAVCGTPGYMAPEQARGDRDDLSEASDIYALGAILFAILTSKRPFSGLKIEAVVRETANGSIPEFPLKIDIPKALKAIVTKAMAGDKQERYASVAELQGDIDSYLQGYATRAEDPDIFTVLAHFCRRNSRFLTISTMVLTLISLIIYTSFVMIKKTETEGIIEKEIAVKEQQLESIDKILKATALEEKSLRNQFKFKEALKLYPSLRKSGYDHPEIWFREALLQFGEFNFKEAFNCLDRVSAYPEESIQEYRESVDEFRSMKKYDKANETDIIKFAFKPGDSAIRSHAIWNINNMPNKSMEQKLETLKKSLLVFNPKINPNELKIAYTLNNNHIQLDLSGNSKLEEIFPLIGLPIDDLDISHTNVNSLNRMLEYFNLSVRKINVSSTKMNFRSHYVRSTNFETIIARDISFAAYDFRGKKNLKHLDLKGSGIYVRDFVYPPENLTYLNIANTKPRKVEGLLNINKLKTLVIDKSNSIDPKTLKVLKHRGVEIIIE